MNKITYFVIAITLMLSSASALEKEDCSGLKKLSKAFIACKSGNLKAGIVNTGSAIKKGTVGKIKKNNENNENTNENSEGLKEKVSIKAEEIKKKASNLFDGSTKQYPKYSKSKKK
jgi:hypothetical protein